MKHLFDYAVIRVVPRVEREEFINVGVIVFCKAEQFLQAKYLIDESRLAAFSPDLDIPTIEKNLIAMQHICLGTKEGGSIGALDIASRFRWITATRSTVIQCSKVHPGYTEEAAHTLEKLFIELVV